MAGVLFSLLAPAQEEESPSPEQITAILELKEASPDEIQEVVSELFEDAICIAQKGSILIQAPPATMEAVKKLIQELESLREKESEDVLEIIQLKYTDPREIEKYLKEILQGDQYSFAIDGQTKQLIVRSKPGVLARVRSLVEVLDRPPPAGPEKEGRQVRLVWLTRDRTGKEKLTPPPGDLKEVLEELAKFDITDLALLSQIMVQTLSEGDFQMGANLSFSGAPCRLSMDGMLRERPDGLVEMELSLEAVKNRPPNLPEEADFRPHSGKEGEEVIQLCNFTTRILAPLGHAVVLGMTPMGSLESVFVIQVLPGSVTGKKKSSLRNP